MITYVRGLIAPLRTMPMNLQVEPLSPSKGHYLEGKEMDRLTSTVPGLGLTV